jgi:hypothetical protein
MYIYDFTFLLHSIVLFKEDIEKLKQMLFNGKMTQKNLNYGAMEKQVFQL